MIIITMIIITMIIITMIIITMIIITINSFLQLIEGAKYFVLL